MLIYGLQKLSLLDYPEKMAATVFTGGCNFCCPFCHNAGLVTKLDESAAISQEEFFSFLEKRKGLLDGVCVSGGEPLLQNGIEEFIKKIKNMGFLVKLDTNGSFPQKLGSLLNKRLVDYVAIDIKNSPLKYAKTAGKKSLDLEKIKESVKLLKSSSIDYEFRTTVVKELHDECDIEEIGKWISGAQRYFLQSFVDSGNLISEGLHAHNEAKMQVFLEIAKKYVPATQLRGI